MQYQDTPTRYGWLSQLLHWLSALLALGLFGLGLWMTGLGYYDSWYHEAPTLHIGLGLILAGLTLIRLGWRCVQTAPPVLAEGLTRSAAQLSKFALYGLLLLLPVTGYLMTGADGSGVDFFGLVTLPTALVLEGAPVDRLGEIHEWAAWALVLLAAVHAGAAGYHHWQLRDATLARMLPGLAEPTRPETRPPLQGAADDQHNTDR